MSQTGHAKWGPVKKCETARSICLAMVLQDMVWRMICIPKIEIEASLGDESHVSQEKTFFIINHWHRIIATAAALLLDC